MKARVWTLIAAAALCLPRDTYADVSSWLAVGGGYGAERDRSKNDFDFAPALTYSVGVGSSPLSSFVVGGLVRGTTLFGLGTDLGVAVRATTGGFARGDWGIGLEAGALWRPWGQGSFGEWPIQGVVTIGSPWGFQLALGTEASSVALGQPALGFFATLEIDLLRLTVMRQGATERWWYNPAPAGGHVDTTAHDDAAGTIASF